MSVDINAEPFAAGKLSHLREELPHSGLDSWQAGELLAAFLTEHGYGVSVYEAQRAAQRIGSVRYSLVQMREELRATRPCDVASLRQRVLCTLSR
jgi:hypothetical protein